MFKVFYVDPMSYRNLAEYDSSLLSEMGLSRDDLEIYFFCSNLFNDDERIERVSINKVFNYNIRKNPILKVFLYTISMCRILFYVFRNQPDVVHFQWFKFAPVDIIVLSILNAFSSCKIVYTAHNFLPHNSGRKYRLLYKLLYQLSHEVIVHAHRTKKEVINLCGKGISVHSIPHGVFINRIKRIPKLGSYQYLLIGEISEYKGVLEMIEAWKSWLDENSLPAVPKLVIRGRCKESFAQKIFNAIGSSDTIDFVPGNLSDKDFDQNIIDCDILVLPYIKGSQSGVLSKAISYSKPFIVSEVGGLDEPLRISEVGWSFSWDAKNSIDSALLNSYAYISNGKIFPDSRWELLRSELSWESIAKSTLGVYFYPKHR
ncbi:glycosyltransferase [Vibrio cyclitrophicus]